MQINPTPPTVNQPLVDARMSLGITQEVMAAAARGFGYPLTSRTISTAENGGPTRPITQARIVLTLQRLGASVTRDELFPPATADHQEEVSA